MQGLFNVCKEIITDYQKYKISYSDSDKKVFAYLNKFQKTLDEFGEEDTIFDSAGQKLYEKNKEIFSGEKRKTWYKNTVKLFLYDKEDNLVRGPAVCLSDIYRLAEYVDEKKPRYALEKEEKYTTRLSKALFKFLGDSCPEFNKIVSAPGGLNLGGAPIPIDFSRITDVINNILDSGIVPGAEKADKEELMNVVNGFMSNPCIGDIFNSVTQMVTQGGEGSPFSAESLGSIVDDIKKNKDKVE